MKNYLKNFDIKHESIIYFFSALIFSFFSFYFNESLGSKELSFLLIIFVVFFGLPHGALDTLIAKKHKIYNNSIQFLTFNIC